MNIALTSASNITNRSFLVCCSYLYKGSSKPFDLVSTVYHSRGMGPCSSTEAPESKSVDLVVMLADEGTRLGSNTGRMVEAVVSECACPVFTMLVVDAESVLLVKCWLEKEKRRM